MEHTNKFELNGVVYHQVKRTCWWYFVYFCIQSVGLNSCLKHQKVRLNGRYYNIDYIIRLIFIFPSLLTLSSSDLWNLKYINSYVFYDLLRIVCLSSELRYFVSFISLPYHYYYFSLIYTWSFPFRAYPVIFTSA